MTIVLTIDNLDALPDGGPTRFTARQRGFEIGREQHLDWSLPDPGRYISGRHCEVRFEGGAYVLYDVSTNGVFVNGASQRVKSPYRLADGDRLSIGHYIIDVSIEQTEAEAGRPAPRAQTPPPPPPTPSGDIWSLDEPAPQPMDRRAFLPSSAKRRDADFSDHFLEFPDIQAPADATPRPPAADPLPAVEPSTPAEGFVPAQRAPQPPPLLDPAAMRPMPGPATPPPPVPPAPGRQPAASGGSFLDAFAAGAGISKETLAKRNPDELAFEIGEFVKTSVTSLMQLLQARAAAKTMTKSASRTMVSATDNNPLKFVPGSSEAIEVMFARTRPGYLGAKGSLDGAFGDLKRHEFATYSAMQKALARLMEDFAPDAIEKKASGSAFASKKSRAWDLYVAKWDEHETGENGLLDTFLAYFAEAYDDINSSGK